MPGKAIPNLAHYLTPFAPHRIEVAADDADFVAANINLTANESGVDNYLIYVMQDSQNSNTTVRVRVYISYPGSSVTGKVLVSDKTVSANEQVTLPGIIAGILHVKLTGISGGAKWTMHEMHTGDMRAF